jgi:hypothetical protein
MTKRDASEQSHRTASAISSGRPILPIGSSEITFARPSRSSTSEAINHWGIDIASVITVFIALLSVPHSGNV